MDGGFEAFVTVRNSAIRLIERFVLVNREVVMADFAMTGVFMLELLVFLKGIIFCVSNEASVFDILNVSLLITDKIPIEYYRWAVSLIETGSSFEMIKRLIIFVLNGEQYYTTMYTDLLIPDKISSLLHRFPPVYYVRILEMIKSIYLVVALYDSSYDYTIVITNILQKIPYKKSFEILSLVVESTSALEVIASNMDFMQALFASYVSEPSNMYVAKLVKRLALKMPNKLIKKQFIRKALVDRQDKEAAGLLVFMAETTKKKSMRKYVRSIQSVVDDNDLWLKEHIRKFLVLEKKCGNPECISSNELLKCGRCECVRYCSRKCQKKMYKQHKDDCISCSKSWMEYLS